MIQWNVNPEIFSLGFFAPRWYGLAFLIGFLIGYQYFLKLFKSEGRTEAQASSMLTYIFLGTLIGARLGHCLFYAPLYYLNNPLEILEIWKGGLASHGGYLGVMIATLLYINKQRDMSFFWAVDRLSAPAILTGSFIRIGNLFNSEIYGKPADVPWSFVFELTDPQKLPRHPTQLYESFGYLVIALFLFWLVKKLGKDSNGRVFGCVMALAYSWRFFVEFFKENQSAFEDGMFLNMGQLLSIPFILFGIFLITGYQKKVPLFTFLIEPWGFKKKKGKA